ncbi:PQQ-dependent sugar dehydrogenase [Micromonospora sp. NBC_01699]|uniref:PQQ-dependent sugar dehydrogenase n=1 Tax=Micromonospora sp. NBC_01699 TaxID=2975984 RepID=UPI002E32F36A|nr:PQQ-dependent sugar dehydrogenase [Micromonospora sp. NBC_01699]
MRGRLIVGLATAIGVGVAGLVAVTAPAAGGVGVAAIGDFDFTRPQVVATNLQTPWGMAFLPDGSALVAERNSARVLQLRPGQTPQQVALISGVAATGEAGLLGLAVSPSYGQDGYVYAYFTSSSDNRIVRFRLTAPQTQTPILTGLARAAIHDGGRIGFGPDGMLYAGVGDAGQTGSAQDPQSRNGKILRMRPDGGVPTDNPTAGSLVYSLGHRNVQGLAWDGQGRLYASEFGQNTWDEVNQIVPGGNYGWPTVEGRANDPRFRDPIVAWTTAEASPSGAAIAGNRLFVAALRGTRLWTVPLTGNGGAGTPVAQLTGQYGRLRTVAYGPDGWLWVSTSNRDGRGTPATTDDRVLRFPPLDAPPTSTLPPTTAPPTTAPPTTAPPTTPPPTTAPPTTAPPTTPPPAGSSCTVGWATNQWSTGFTANLTITNRGPALNGWTLTWAFTGGQQVTSAWNSVITQSGQNVSARNATWNGAIATNASTTLGFQANHSGNTPRPAEFRLNGTVCGAG